MTATTSGAVRSGSRVGVIPNLMALGIFWGLSPVMTKALSGFGVFPLQIIAWSSLFVGIALLGVWRAFGPVRLNDARLWLFGVGCAVTLNIPFFLSLSVVGHVPLSTYSIITATTPLFGYSLAVITRVERVTLTRLLAVLCGFLGAAILLIDPKGIGAGIDADPWVLATFGLPLLYALYHLYTSRFWPKDRETGAVGVAENIAAGLLFLPLLFVINGSDAVRFSPLGFSVFAIICVVWVIERIAFFNLIRHFGPVSTVQAVNLATVCSVAMGAVIYGEPIDARIILSGVLVLAALWLNARAEQNRARSII